jgi:SAM-dependent methyltransferase
VVDSDQRFHDEALRWFATLHRVAGVDPTDLVVHSVGGGGSEVLDYLQVQGVSVVDVPAFDGRSPHCNKISGALSLAQRGVDGLAVLTDTDVVILEDPRRVSVPPGAVASKPVDNRNPPLRVLKNLFASAEVALPPLIPLDWHPEGQTVAGNGNGGLYLVPGAVLTKVAQAWEHWARWLLERTDIPGHWDRYTDQMAMALGLAAEGVEAFRLDPRWNLPTHDLELLPADIAAPAVIHYHKNVNRLGLLTPTGIAAIDGQIDMANEAIGQVWHEAFPNATWWEWRYRPDRDLSAKFVAHDDERTDDRDPVLSLVEILKPKSVLHVGDAGGLGTKTIPVESFTELDVWADHDHPIEAELTICPNLLLQESTASGYRNLVESLLKASSKALLVSGYERKPENDSPTAHFHEPLSETLARFAPEAEQYPLGDVGGISTFLVLHPPKDKHRRDFGPATLSQVVGRHWNPLRLLSLRTSAWSTIGFFPDHTPRLWEYPTAAELLMNLLKPGSRILDIGAGVNPLVPYLAEKGYEVETVDLSTRLREWPSQPDWNEWGFLDYAAVGLAHRSWNCRLDELPADSRFDALYCLSVIEHLVASDRRSLLRDMSERTAPGGVVILTVDLVPGGDDLWNRASGKRVEERKKHGTLQDLISEAQRTGLETVDQVTIREWGDSPVDIGLFVMRRTSAVGSDLSFKSRIRAAANRFRSH